LIFIISESQGCDGSIFMTVLSARILATSSARAELIQYESTTRWTIHALKVYKNFNGRAVQEEGLRPLGFDQAAYTDTSKHSIKPHLQVFPRMNTWLFETYRRQCKSNPITVLDRPCVFQEAEAPRFQDNRHMKVVRLLALRTGHLYRPGNIPGIHFC